MRITALMKIEEGQVLDVTTCLKICFRDKLGLGSCKKICYDLSFMDFLGLPQLRSQAGQSCFFYSLDLWYWCCFLKSVI